MLQGVRSSCPRPVCSLRSEPRSAARSRSQRATRTEASLADRGLKSYSRLQLALDKLEKSLLAPRINKEAAQGQVQMVAADTLWVASEVGRKLSRAQHSAAMAATDKEIILLHLQNSVAAYLRIKGMLHPCGLLEYAEQKLFFPLNPDFKEDRLSKWQQLGRRHPKLEACILAANPSWQADLIPAKVVQLHSELLQQVHSGDLPASGNKVLLMEGLLSPEDVRFLKCVADAVHCPYELW